MGALTRTSAATSAWIAGVCGLAAAGAVAALLALEHSASAPVVAPTARIEVAASFDPPVVLFGDRILARVVVALDTRRVQPQTLRLTDHLAPLTQLGTAGTSHMTQGSLELVTFVVPLSCLTAPCVARSGVVRVVLPLVHASVLERDGRIVRASAAWPTLSVRGRVTAADLAARTPPFAADTTPPAPTYRIAPGELGTWLTLLAVLCAAGALAFAGWEAHLRIGRRRRQPTALDRALRLTREAELRPAADRRRALALLGRALERDQRSSAVRELAWSEAVPEPDELERLVTDIEQGGGR
ncbi:MAG: hypothetical protein ABSB73_08625 [Solirubrobacteraceae bacterium]|jgi:hypothetical protein